MNKVAQNGIRTGDTRLWVFDKRDRTLPLRYPAHGDCCRNALYVVMKNRAWFQSELVFMCDRLEHATVNPRYIVDHTHLQL